MNAPHETVVAACEPAPPEARPVEELLAANEALRRENAELARRITRLEQTTVSARESRRAALNLMEDAVASHRRAEALNQELLREVTERTRADAALRETQERQMFLLRLGDALRLLRDPTDIQMEAARRLGEFLNVDRATYADVEDGEYVVKACHSAGLPPLIGRFPGSRFGARLVELHQRGDTVAVSDVRHDPLFSADEQARLLDYGIAAFCEITLWRAGGWVGLLALQHASPRSWTPGEIELAREVAERIGMMTERARSEQALRASEEQYRTLFTSLDEGYVLADVVFEAGEPVDLFYIDANPAAVRLAGAPLAGRHARELPNTLEAQWLQVFGRVARTGVSERHETYSEPHRRWYEYYVFGIGEPATRRVAAIFQDINTRKRRESHLAFLAAISEDFARLSTEDEIMRIIGARAGAYLDVTTCLFGEVDEHHGQLVNNLGWQADGAPPLLGRPWNLARFLATASGTAMLGGESILVRGTPDRESPEPRHDDMAEVPAYVSIPFHRQGTWKFLLTVADSRPRDWQEDEIDLLRELANRAFPRLERARAEAALRASEERQAFLLRFSDILRPLTDPIAVQNAAAQLIADHLGVARAYYAECERDTGRCTVRADFVREGTSRVGTFELEALSPHAPRLREGYPVVVTDAQGGTLTATLTERYAALGIRAVITIPLFGENVLTAILTVCDSAPRAWTAAEVSLLQELAQRTSAAVDSAQAELAVRRSEDMLRHADRRKNEFLAMLGHELRNPLAAIKGGLNLLQSARARPESRAAALPIVAHQVAHMERLIDDVLDLARIERGKLQVKPERLALQDIVQAAAAMVQEQLAARSCVLQQQIPAEPVMLDADPVRLTQVLVNVLTNAVKFSPAGRPIDLVVERDGGEAVVRIRDYGTGIPPDLLPQIFDPFVQLKRSLAIPEGGLGLGLAVCRELVLLHGGTITGWSAGEDQGSEFVVRLPLPQTP